MRRRKSRREGLEEANAEKETGKKKDRRCRDVEEMRKGRWKEAKNEEKVAKKVERRTERQNKGKGTKKR